MTHIVIKLDHEPFEDWLEGRSRISIDAVFALRFSQATHQLEKECGK